MGVLTNASTEKSFHVSHYPIDDREQDLAADARFLQNVPLGLQKNCIDRLGQRINLFVRWGSSDS